MRKILLTTANVLFWEFHPLVDYIKELQLNTGNALS